MLVDSHCHLDRLDLDGHSGSLDAALAAARARGVGKLLCIGVDAAHAPVAAMRLPWLSAQRSGDLISTSR